MPFRKSEKKPWNKWEFNVFQVSEASKQRPLTYVLYELLKKYGLLSTFKASLSFTEILFRRDLSLTKKRRLEETCVSFRYPPMYWWVLPIVLIRDTASFGIPTTIQIMRPTLLKRHTSSFVRLVSFVNLSISVFWCWPIIFAACVRAPFLCSNRTFEHKEQRRRAICVII